MTGTETPATPISNCRLAGKRALVTGAASGIGKAITARFLAEGASVACLDINREALRATASEFGSKQSRVFEIVCDVTNADSVRAAVEQAAADMGGLDIVVNNVGLSGRGTVETTTEADWDRISLNTKSVFLVSKWAVPHLRAAQGGAIINISSCTGVHAETNRVAYGTAKAAIIMMTRLMALDHGPDAIRVNAVAPGVTETTLSQGNRSRAAEARNITLDDITREITDTYPLGRTGDPGEIASGVLFLASDEARWITGICLSIDGGWSAGEYRRIQ